MSDITELLNALRPFANIASDPALMADVLRGMRPHEAATLREALETARLLVEQVAPRVTLPRGVDCQCAICLGGSD